MSRPRSSPTLSALAIRRGAIAGLALGASILAFALGAAPALAQAPFTLEPSGDAEQPHVAVDDRGAAHVVWNQRVAGGREPGDVTNYCRVPRGQRACDRRERFRAPDHAIGRETWVLAPSEDRVVVVSNRCCDPGEIFAWISDDGGSSFGARRTISTEVWPRSAGDGVVAGPGPFAVSVLGGLGMQFQAAPLDGPPAETWAELGSQAGQPDLPLGHGVAFIDALTPIVAMGTNEGDVYFRRFGGGAAYNDVGSWGPPTLVVRGADNTDNRIASLPSGRRGVHLLTLEGAQRRFVHRRFDGERFANPIQVSAPEDTGRLQDFFLDESGRLHALWTDPGTANVRHRTSPDGVRWGTTETLLSDFFGGAESFRADTACDGGGLGVFNKGPGSGIEALPFGPTGRVDCEAAADPTCIDSVSVGRNVVVEAQEGCFTRKKGTLRSRGDVRVNGIDLLVGGGGGASAAAAARVIVDRKARTLRTTRRVTARVGNVLLGREKLAWRLPRRKGEIRDLAGNPATLNAKKRGSDLLGLPVSGFVVPRITGRGEGALRPNVRLPAPFTGMLGGGATGEAPLRFDNARGLDLRDLKLDVKDASIGIAGLSPFELRFDAGTSTLTGKGDLKLPVVGSGLETEFQLTGGAFDFGRASLQFPGTGIPLAPKVFLRRIDFSIEAGRGCKRPTKLSAGGRIVAVPGVVGDFALLDVDPLSASYSFPKATCGQPGVFEVRGDGKLLDLGNARLGATYKTSGQFTFGAGLDFDLSAASAAMSVEGGVDLRNARFYALGQAQAELFSFELAGVDALVSSRGVAACGPAPPIPPPVNPLAVLKARGGFEYRWGERFRIDWPPACEFDLEALIPAELQAAPSGARARSASRAQLTVPRDARSVLIQIDGNQGAPGFVLSGPGGLRIEHPGGDADPVSTDEHEVFPAPSASVTNVRISSPRPGAYTVDDRPGEDAIAGVAHALPLPKPKVRAKVSGRGAKRVLRFRARRVKGQSLRFVEQGKGRVRAPIGRTAKARGRLRFRPSSGPGGKRRVVAIVEQSGAPRARLGVTSYRAPKAQLPRKPRKLRLRRKRRKLVVSWRKVARAKRYAVAWKLRDGRRGAKVVRKRRVVIKKVPGINAGKIRVAGLRADNVAGKAARAKLKPKPKKRKRRGKRNRRRR